MSRLEEISIENRMKAASEKEEELAKKSTDELKALADDHGKQAEDAWQVMRENLRELFGDDEEKWPGDDEIIAGLKEWFAGQPEEFRKDYHDNKEYARIQADFFFCMTQADVWAAKCQTMIELGTAPEGSEESLYKVIQGANDYYAHTVARAEVLRVFRNKA